MGLRLFGKPCVDVFFRQAVRFLLNVNGLGTSPLAIIR